MGVIDILFFAIISTAMYVYVKMARETGNNLLLILFVICASMALIAVMMNFYTFLMIISTDVSFKNILKNSLVLTLLITGVFIVAIIWNLSFILLLPFVPAAIICFIICFNSYPVVQKYVINPYYEQRGEVNPEIGTADTDDEDVIFEDKGGSEKPIEKSKGKKGKIIS